MSSDARKRVFRVSGQVRYKPSCTATRDDSRLEISDLERKGILLTTINAVKTKELISFADTLKLICVFVFAYVKICWVFFHIVAQIGNIANVTEYLVQHVQYIYVNIYFLFAFTFDTKLYDKSQRWFLMTFQNDHPISHFICRHNTILVP